MGVPALFRWLSNKYPKIISAVIEERPREVDGGEIPVDYTQENPNGEVDNLYLDMNGIVHPCSHPEDKPPPETEADMMLEIFKYTDRVVHMARPRKLLMIAIDGVAPRAKMNQQRSRRFRSAQEKKEKDDEKAEFLKLLAQQNGGVLPASALESLEKKSWDSNAITPGTPFMSILAASLRYWVAYKLNTDPSWANLKIIISDATVPGEGEHKIMEFIRSQRSSGEHDPNTQHVIYGLDADLIMLGIATHEPHFRVLREDVFFQESKGRACRICGQEGHFAAECRGEAKKKEGEFDEKTKAPAEKPFIWLHVSVLREYLAIEMHPPNQPFNFDLERALDDWVFMCFFVGNDFLPHLPSLDIREQGIDTLIAIWRDQLPIMGGYVTKDGHVDLERAQLILQGLSKQEDAIFKKRKEIEGKKEAAARRRKADEERRAESQGGKRQKRVKGDDIPMGANVPTMSLEEFGKTGKWKADGMHSGSANGLTHEMVVNRGNAQDTNAANKSAAAVLKERLMEQKNGKGQNDTQESNGTQETDASQESPANGLKRKASEIDGEEPSTPGRKSPVPDGTMTKPDPDAPPPDEVRLWEEGYADRYYESKFHVAPSDHDFRHKVGRAYAEGLAWVLLYYFQGCPSWNWYYPYHYAPFAADFVDIKEMKIGFEKGKPFKPYEQLMGVMPTDSNHTIPEAFHPLMTDDDSDIKSFYPEDFHVDLNGKKFAWQGVAILPFIDEKRLLAAMATKYPLLTKEEHDRNEMGREALLFSDKHPLYDGVAQTLYGKLQGAPLVKLDAKLSEGLSGKIEKNEEYLPSGPLIFPAGNDKMPDLDEDRSMSVFYELPRSTNIHKSMLMRGVKLADPVLDLDDINQTTHRASRTGRDFTGGGFRGGRGRGDFRGDFRGGRRDSGRRDSGRNDRNGGPPPYDNRANPFASHLNPAYFPNGPPPPPHAMQAGWVPPPPPQFAAQYGNRGPPPPPHGMNGGYGGQQYGRHQQPYQQQQQQYYGQGGGYGNGGYGGGGHGHRNGRR